MDIRPQRPKPPIPEVPATPTPPVPGQLPAPLPIEANPSGLDVKQKKRKRIKKIILFSVLGIIVLLIAFVVAMVFWYNAQLAPQDSSNTRLRVEVIEPNMTPQEIGELLKDEGIIRNTQAFVLYTRISKTGGKLQAGTYRLSPSESTPDIVAHLVNGTVDTFDITFLPGSTLAENRATLIKAGYTKEQVDAGLSETYDSPLFDTKPATADLEGYIYGETYNFSTSATVEDILNRTFAQYEQVVVENNLVAQFKAHGLSLYQGITLASIVQREAVKGSEAQIAQVFYSRLAANMPLGSDVTYQYIADKTGVARDPNLDSPYNTRRYTGLPPGPIAVPGLSALKAVADPASGDYLYFLSGDDDVTYYARTLSEHEANISAHCKVKCSTL